MTKGPEDAAVKVRVTNPAHPAPPETPAPKAADGLVECATDHGWRKHDVLIASGEREVKVKSPPTEPGRKYSMLPQFQPYEQYIVRLVKGRCVLALVWVNGKFHALSNKPLGRYNTRTVRKFMEAFDGE